MTFQETFEILRSQCDEVADTIEYMQRKSGTFDDIAQSQIGTALETTVRVSSRAVAVIQDQLTATAITDTSHGDDLDAILAAEAAALDPSDPRSAAAQSQKEILEQMTGSLKLLGDVVQVHLGAASTCKQTLAAVGDKATRIRAIVNEFRDSVTSHLDDVRETLSDERQSLSRLQDLVRECQDLLRETGEDLDDNRTLKRGANIARVGLWGAALFVPGYAIAAAAAEWGAHKLRQDRREIKEARSRLDSALHQGRNKIKALEAEARELSDMETDLVGLVSRCSGQSDSMEEAARRASRAEGSIRVLDGACSELVIRVRRMETESEGMANVLTSGQLLREALRRFVSTAVGSGQEYVLRICAPLAELLQY